MKYFKKLIGERCYLSPMSLEDVDLYTKWLNDLEVTRFLQTVSACINVETEGEFVAKLSRDHNYTIVSREGDKPVGVCGLVALDQLNRCAECGIFIGEKDFWGRGYGAEALKLLLSYSFNYLNLNNVMLRVYGFNHRAHRCYLKCGFKEMGIRRKSLYREGQWWDETYLDILAEEFTS